MGPTRDHAEIRRWADRHDAVPAEIHPLKFDGEPSALYFLFGKAKAGTPEILPITWDSFFARFDLLKLSIVFEDRGSRFAIVRLEKPSDHALSH